MDCRYPNGRTGDCLFRPNKRGQGPLKASIEGARWHKRGARGSSKRAKESVEGAKRSTMGHCEGAGGRTNPETDAAAFSSMKRLPPPIFLTNLNPICCLYIVISDQCRRTLSPQGPWMGDEQNDTILIRILVVNFL